MVDHDKLAQKYSQLVLEHFLMHKDAVALKLGHARTATKKGLEDHKDSDDLSQNEIDNMHQYDQLWDEVIKGFNKSAVTEADLNIIEKFLGALPKVIKAIYDFLVEQDEKLTNLLKKMASTKYQEALQMVEKIHALPDPMSGMTSDDYDEALETGDAKVYKPLYSKFSKLLKT